MEGGEVEMKGENGGGNRRGRDRRRRDSRWKCSMNGEKEE